MKNVYDLPHTINRSYTLHKSTLWHSSCLHHSNNNKIDKLNERKNTHNFHLSHKLNSEEEHTFSNSLCPDPFITVTVSVRFKMTIFLNRFILTFYGYKYMRVKILPQPSITNECGKNVTVEMHIFVWKIYGMYKVDSFAIMHVHHSSFDRYTLLAEFFITTFRKVLTWRHGK